MDASHLRIRSLAITAFLLAAVAWPLIARADDIDGTVKLARQYLSSESSRERRRLAAKLNEYEGDFQPVLDRLSAKTYEPVRSGYRPERHFSDPELLEKHPDDLLYFMVPKGYRPETATGLIIFMHGGGKTSSRRAPRL